MRQEYLGKTQNVSQAWLGFHLPLHLGLCLSKMNSASIQENSLSRCVLRAKGRYLLAGDLPGFSPGHLQGGIVLGAHIIRRYKLPKSFGRGSEIFK